MRFTTIVAGIALIAGVQAIDSSAVEIKDENILVTTAKCKDGYFDCITNCPFIIPDCSTWGLNCAIIYC